MKVLFAVSNEEISESIVKKYQKEYKQIISYKNVYYFNAILKELQKDKSYDRVVISEDLEAFTHTQYDQIDKFIFEKLDAISDEASTSRGDDTPIIVICSDRRTKSEQMLVKLFGIGIYNAIIGNDRSVDEVCRLINRPRIKKEAKLYYKIDAEEVNYQAENENDVSEMEIQNILAHYKRLGKNEDRYIDSFNNIAAQYNDTQLRIISKFLPLNVRAVLEEKSTKYQQIMSFNNSVSDSLRKTKNEEDDGPSQILLKSKNKETIMSKPVVIPSAVNMTGTKKLARKKPESNIEVYAQSNNQQQTQYKPVEKTQEIKPEPIIEGFEDLEIEKEVEKVTPEVVQPVKRGRGRPRKTPVPTTTSEVQPKRGRGRPRKNPVPETQTKIEEFVLPGMEEQETDIEDNLLPGFEDFDTIDTTPTSQVKTSKPQIEQTAILPGFDDDDELNEVVLPGIEENETEDMTLPGFDNEDESEDMTLPGFDEDESEDMALPGFDDEEPISMPQPQPQPSNSNNYGYSSYNQNNANINAPKPEYNYEETIDLSSLLTPDKKIVTFVGTSKNGTSFIVNNIAELMSSIGINTAILDTTKNRNSYYIYTKNEEALRQTATQSIEGLAHGIAKGISVNKNLTVYTSLPNENDFVHQSDKILETLLQSHSLILIDTDFDTPLGYFKQSQETYLVQTMDILTIQPLTAFLKQLKMKNILDETKLKIVLNKVVKIRGIKEATIIGGMAFYNDPSMSFMTELFDRDRIKYVSIPFDEETYIRYLEGIIECEISLKGYSKIFIQTLRELGNMVYPVINQNRGNQGYQPPSAYNNGGGSFSPSMNNTLDKMKRGY